MNSQTIVCVIGAGPYGTAVAAYLRHAGVAFRIFGSPMRRWLSQMPKEMLLKSEGCASGLPDPNEQFTLPGFCRKQGLLYGDYGKPVSREIFAKYALSYQQKFVPEVEDVRVTGVKRNGGHFEVQLSTGEVVRCAHVIVATGLEHMERIPEKLSKLPPELYSHSSAHYDLGKFKGMDVVVIGAGQSGLEMAALARDHGASVTLVVRASTVSWNKVPVTTHRSFYQRLRRPRTQLGEGLQLWVYDNVPQLFRRLPRKLRIGRVKRSLGPAGGWWLRKEVEGRVPMLLGHKLEGAEEKNGRVELHLKDPNGQSKVLIADHIVAATGYKFDFECLPFLDRGIKAQIRHEEQQPRLSPYFESSVPGLYFCGLSSAYSFGPVMRFLAGTAFTARRIATHIASQERVAGVSFSHERKCAD